jgi:hypothetical protein
MELMQYFIIALDYGGCRGIVMQEGTISDVKKSTLLVVELLHCYWTIFFCCSS